MWKFSATMTLINLFLATTQADYTIVASNLVGSYHYPAPPKSQQLYDPASSLAATHRNQNQYEGNYRSAAVTTKQFASPALENVAFSLALTNQGYIFGNAPALSASRSASSRSSKTTLQTLTSSSSSSPSTSSSSSSSSSSPVIGSLNIKLPLPFGVTPLNLAPLPLQAGAPYATIPNCITSYGTIYPQRKRR